MTSTRSFLHPPNNYSFSDAIVGNVLERTYLHGSRFNCTANHQDSTSNGSTQAHDFISTVSSKEMETTTFNGPFKRTADMLPTTEVIKEVKNFVDQNCLPPHDSIPRYTRKYNKRSIFLQRRENDGQYTCIPRAMMTRRDRCRVNQARYRDRQRKFKQDLEGSVQKLKEDVYKLEIQKQHIARFIPTGESVWEVVLKYFRLFEYGYMVPFREVEFPSTSRNALRSGQSHAQLKFLQATMVLDMPDGTLCGVDALLENWRLLSLYHKNLHVQLKCLEQGPGDSLVATTTTSLTITENTLRNVYPHLLTNTEDGDEGKQWSPLAVSLLNQRLVVPGTVRFDWDAVCSRVVRMESTADMLTPILRLVGSLEDVAQVFDGAFVTPELRMTKS